MFNIKIKIEKKGKINKMTYEFVSIFLIVKKNNTPNMHVQLGLI